MVCSTRISVVAEPSFGFDVSRRPQETTEGGFTHHGEAKYGPLLTEHIKDEGIPVTKLLQKGQAHFGDPR